MIRVPFLVLLLCNVMLAADIRRFEDANLHALDFVDEFEGWAVGDHGTVWHTMDGGILWERQPTGTIATLSGIDMRDYRQGWIAARESLALNPSSQGSLFWTRDGGGKWILANRNQLSGARGVQFADPDHGWTWGEATDQNPTGLYFTTNSGRSWLPLPGERRTGWLTGWIPGFEQGFLAGPGPSLAQLSNGALRTIPNPPGSRPGTALRSLAASGDHIWAVGDAGQIWCSPNGGRTFEVVRPEMDPELLELFDWHGVAAVGDKVWIVGRPGSVVLHSTDAGASWVRQTTPQSLPLAAVHFANGEKGYAVGAMGTILATQDGGQTWQPQHVGGGRRAALLWSVLSGESVPFSVVARHGAEQGYRLVAVEWGAADPNRDPLSSGLDATRFAEAFRLAGGTTAETRTRFPVARAERNIPAAVALGRWNQRLEGKADERVLREMVFALRMYRPEVILTDDPQEETLAGWLAERMRTAFDLASDPAAFPELAMLGLEPHQPKKIYARSSDSTDSVTMDGGQYSPLLGETYSEAAEAPLARGRVEFATEEATVHYRLLARNGEEKGAERSLVAAIDAPVGSDARNAPYRSMTAEDAQAAIQQKRLAERRRNLLAIARQPELLGGPDALLAELGQTVKQFPPDQAGRVLFTLGQQYTELGRWELAKVCFETLAREFPEHSLTLESLRLLLAYETSSEIRAHLPPMTIVTQATESIVPRRKVDADGNPAEGETRRSTTATTTAFNPRGVRIRGAEQAVLYGNGIRRASPHFFADPRIQLNLAAAQRILGSFELMRFHQDQVVESDRQGHWAPVVRLERWLFDRSQPPARPILFSPVAQEKPYLDGDLGDPAWEQAKPIVLQNPVSALETKDFATRIRCCHDAEYLYFSGECRVPEGTTIRPLEPRQGHDPDQTGYDLVEICIDVDRDYTTFCRIRVDEAGRVADDCFGDRSWNANLFASVTQGDEGWQFELAIPWTDLVAPTDEREAVWAIGLERRIPGKGGLGIDQAAGHDTQPERFTLLEFDRGKPARRPSQTPLAN